MDHLPYPPVPEFGWYDDDMNSGSAVQGAVVSDPDESDHTDLADDNSDESHVLTPAQELIESVNIADMQEDVKDWDGTVLSDAFTVKEPETVYLLHNESTGKNIVVNKSTLLGRKPSGTVPERAQSQQVDDPTRTVSRNHAAISFDQEGAIWIEDYGSLNGTYIIHDNLEVPVRGKRVKFNAPVTIRLGDQVFDFSKS